MPKSVTRRGRPASGGGRAPQFSISLPPEVIARLDQIAHDRWVPRAQIVREALSEWLKRHDAADERVEGVA